MTVRVWVGYLFFLFHPFPSCSVFFLLGNWINVRVLGSESNEISSTSVVSMISNMSNSTIHSLTQPSASHTLFMVTAYRIPIHDG